jgi:hypothetical protein
MTNILQSSESPRVNLRALPASNSVLTWLVLAPRDTPNAERRPGARDSHMTHRWRKPDSNHRSRGKRPASPRCRLSFAPYFGWRGESCANLHAGGAGPDGGESDRSWSATGARGGTASGGGGSWSATGARGCCRRCCRRSCNLGLYGVPAALLPATLRSSSAIVGTRAMPQWPRCPRSHPRNPRLAISRGATDQSAFPVWNGPCILLREGAFRRRSSGSNGAVIKRALKTKSRSQRIFTEFMIPFLNNPQRQRKAITVLLCGFGLQSALV